MTSSPEWRTACEPIDWRNDHHAKVHVAYYLPLPADTKVKRGWPPTVVIVMSRRPDCRMSHRSRAAVSHQRLTLKNFADCAYSCSTNSQLRYAEEKPMH